MKYRWLVGLSVAAFLWAIFFYKTMEYTCAFAAVAVLLYLYAEYCNKRKNDLSARNANLEEKAKWDAKRIGNLEEKKKELLRYKSLAMRGCDNLNIKHVPAVEPFKKILVVSQSDVDSSVCFIIKGFKYDTQDPDGYDFALREAEELIDKLKE